MEKSDHFHVPTALPPGKKPTAPSEWENGLASEMVWTFRRREQSVAPDRAGRSLVTALNKLSRFLHYNMTLNKPAAIWQREVQARGNTFSKCNTYQV